MRYTIRIHAAVISAYPEHRSLLNDPKVHIEIDDGSSVGAVKTMILEKHGGEPAMFVFREDSDEALDEAVLIVAGIAAIGVGFFDQLQG